MNDATTAVLYIVGIGLGLGAMYLIIRAAVKGALRDHHEWLGEQKAAPAKSEDSTGAA